MIVTNVRAADYCAKTGIEPVLTDDIYKFVLADGKYGFKVNRATGEMSTDNVRGMEPPSLDDIMEIMDRLALPVDHYFSEARPATSMEEIISDKELELHKLKRRESILNFVIAVIVIALISTMLLAMYLITISK